jgi:DNA-binding transcriptional LysR family regulator
MYRMDWDDARLFLAVVRAGSLRAAGRKLGISQPTVGRRLARFEAAASDVPLFDRLPEGLRLTTAGQAVVPLAEKLEEAAAALQRRQREAEQRPLNIRVSVGEWAGGFLAQCLSQTETSNRLPEGLCLELVASDQTANLSRREADLAVRHGRPETGDLYISRIGAIACAAYAGAGARACTDAWITYTQEQAHYAQARWIAATIGTSGGTIAARASSVSMQAAVARAGCGAAVLPCYVGDADPTLVRVLGRIEALDAPHWLIVHRDLRRLPYIRSVLDWITHVFSVNRATLEGRSSSSLGADSVPAHQTQPPGPHQPKPRQP